MVLCARMMINVEGMDGDIVTWVCAIEALAVVCVLLLLAAFRTNKTKFHVNLNSYWIRHDIAWRGSSPI